MVYFDGFNILASDLSHAEEFQCQPDVAGGFGVFCFVFHCMKYFQGSFDQEHNMKLLQQAQNMIAIILGTTII